MAQAGSLTDASGASAGEIGYDRFAAMITEWGRVHPLGRPKQHCCCRVVAVLTGGSRGEAYVEGDARHDEEGVNVRQFADSHERGNSGLECSLDVLGGPVRVLAEGDDLAVVDKFVTIAHFDTLSTSFELAGRMGLPAVVAIAQAADLLGTGRSKVRELLRTGDLPATRLSSTEREGQPRIPLAALVAYTARHTTQADTPESAR